MDDFEIDGRLFASIDNGYTHMLRDSRIRIGKLSTLDGYAWYAMLMTTSGGHVTPDSEAADPREAAESALAYWKGEIEESDRLDAEDSDRERREFEREQTLGTRDVL